MRTAECNVCGETWPIVNEDGVNLVPKLRLEGACHCTTESGQYREMRVGADLCSFECVIVFARDRQKEMASICQSS